MEGGGKITVSCAVDGAMFITADNGSVELSLTLTPTDAVKLFHVIATELNVVSFNGPLVRVISTTSPTKDKQNG